METHWIRVFNWLIFVDLKRTYFAVYTYTYYKRVPITTNFFFSSRTIKQLSVPLCTDLYSIANWKMNQVNIKRFLFSKNGKRNLIDFYFSSLSHLVSIHLFIYIHSTLKKKLVWKEVPSNNFNIKRSGTVHIWSL